MKKLFAGMLIFLMGMTGAYAKSSGNFSSVINDSGLEKNSIAISINKRKNSYASCFRAETFDPPCCY